MAKEHEKEEKMGKKKEHMGKSHMKHSGGLGKKEMGFGAKLGHEKKGKSGLEGPRG
jgi:hypothetical protein